MSKRSNNIKNPYTIIHSSNKPFPGDYIIASVDPGICNFALRVEARDFKVKNIRLIAYYNVDLTCGRGVDKKQSLGVNLAPALIQLTTFLNDLLNIFESCHMFIIERQLPRNFLATRICQHVISFLLIKLDTNKLPSIIEISPRLKCKMLGAPPGTKGKQLKKWSVDTATKLLEIYKDTTSLQLLKQANKRDDLADTFCQIEAFL